MLTRASLPNRLGLALVPGLAVSGLVWVGDILSLGAVAESVVSWSYALLLGICVLAPFADIATYRRLRIAGLVATPSGLIVFMSGVFALLPSVDLLWNAALSSLVYGCSLAWLTALLAPRVRGRRFMPYTAAFGIACALAAPAATFGFEACFLSGCSAIEEALMHGGIGSILLFLPPAFVVTVWYASDPLDGSVRRRAL